MIKGWAELHFRDYLFSDFQLTQLNKYLSILYWILVQGVACNIEMILATKNNVSPVQYN